MNQIKNDISASGFDEMENKKIKLKSHQVIELLVLCGLIFILLLYLLLRSAASFSYKLPEFDKVTGIESMRWSRSDGSEINLSKKGEQWYIDNQYPAKQNNVDTLLGQLSEPSLQDLVSKSGNLLTFGLNNERAYKLEAFDSNGDVLRQLYIGKSSSSGRYSFTRLSEDDWRIFTLSENLTSVLEKSIDNLRDRLVLSFSSSDIEKLEISESASDKSISIAKQDSKWQIPEGHTWNEEQVDSFVNRFASMNAQDFLAEYPQTDDEYQLKFIAKGGVSYIVTIAAQKLEDDKGYAAKSSSYGFPFTLNNYTVESILEDFGFVDTETDADTEQNSAEET